jgi:hypothetical protein
MRRPLATLSLIVAVAACGGDKAVGTTPIGEVVGTYSLTTINGATLPFVYARQGADTDEVLDDAITITPSGEWSEIWHDRYTRADGVTTQEFTDGGLFSRTGTSITFVSTRGGYLQGSLSGNTLSFTAPGATLIYLR